jgi:hypothetical protein
MSRSPLTFCLLPSLAVMLSACASTKMAAEWSNKDFAGRSLRGERVLVVCQAPDDAVRRLCEDQLVTDAGARGVTAVRLADRPLGVPPNAPVPADVYRAGAKSAGAVAILSMALEPDATVVNPGPVFGIGVGGGTWGGGGWGRGGGSFGGVGVGTSVGIPAGPGTVQTGFAASTQLVDAETEQIAWSGRAVAPPSEAFVRQLIDLSRVTFEAMAKAGLL